MKPVRASVKNISKIFAAPIAPRGRWWAKLSDASNHLPRRDEAVSFIDRVLVLGIHRFVPIVPTVPVVPVVVRIILGTIGTAGTFGTTHIHWYRIRGSINALIDRK